LALIIFKKQWHKALTPSLQHQKLIHPSLNPVFTENDKSTPPKAVVINGTHGLQVTYSGTGVVKGVNFSAIGTVLLIPRSDGAVDLSGHAVIIASNGEKGNYTFYSIGRTGADGTTRDNVLHFSMQTQAANLALLII
jgi:hypothetical protein